ncbi:hypothetical protein B4U80_14305 [Leptotrombidium deliense]|uniref:Uncharacterized protein n=1 Tax=Leptotrombidium deliense TaxID=299467 RepID=A0A443RXY5_9ACAR|nr:hypothetical protein B4U80_14305 [Leptotrombidium deliense]
MCFEGTNGSPQQCAICANAFISEEYSMCLTLWFVNNANCPLCGSLELKDFSDVFEKINKGIINYIDHLR